MPQYKQHEKKLTDTYAQRSMVGQLPNELPVGTTERILAERLWLPCRRQSYRYEPRAAYPDYTRH